MFGLLLATGLAHAEPTLDEVLRSVEQHFPLLLAAESELDGARADLLGARGVFDPTISAFGGGKVGYYDLGYADARLMQATPLYGLQLEAGYRVGVGNFPVYDAKLDTLDAGEWFAGLKLPLLKGGLTDASRTAMLVSLAKVAETEAKRDEKRVVYGLAAREAWFKWLAAGEKQALATRATDTARQSLAGVQSRIERGDLPPIDAVDAQRVVAEREAKQLEASRDLRIAGWKLGLYLRDDGGAPAPPASAPPSLPPAAPATPTTVDDALTQALSTRPELAQLTARLDAIDAKLRLARVDVLPKLDLKAAVSQDQPAANEEPQEVEFAFGGEFSVSLLQRGARGKLDRALADREALAAETRYTADRIVADVQSAWITLDTASSLYEVAARQAALARQVEEATRTAWRLGDRTLLDLYLREQSTLKAETDRIEALTAVHVAEALLRATIGLP